MQKNIEIFNYSLKNPETFSDETYKKGELVITRNAKEKNELICRNERLIDLITSYKTLNKNLSDSQKDNIVDEIIGLMFNTREKMNYTAFSQYFMVCDLSYSVVNALPKEDKHLLIKAILDDYTTERHQMYLSHGYSNIVLQVMSDNYSHKRNCSTGAEKVENQILKKSVNKLSSLTQPSKNFYIRIDKDEDLFHKLLKKGNIKLKWSRKKQGKIPDILIHYGNRDYILEHKHMKEGGGGQSKQDTEIVDFIRYKEKNVSYVTYLDGVGFNRLITSKDNKHRKVKEDILEILSQNKDNYFVNTAGFEKFIDEVVLGTTSKK